MKNATKNGIKAMIALAALVYSGMVNAIPTENGVSLPAAESKFQSIFKLQKHNTFANTLQFGEKEFSNSINKSTEETDDVFWIQMVTPQNMVFTSAVIYFEGGQDIYCEDDSPQREPVSEAFYTFAGDTHVVINGRAPFRNTDVVKLGARHYSGGTYTIRIYNKEGVFSQGQNIYLYDKYTSQIINLSEENYSYTAPAGDMVDRFEVIYDRPTMPTSGFTKRDDISMYQSAGTMVLNSPDEKMQLVQLYDSLGNLKYTAYPNSNDFSFNTSSYASGMYILKILTPTGMITKKVRITN